MLNGDISQMCEARVRAMSLIGGNSLKTSLLILMSIVHRSSLLWISCEMMITYRSDTDRVVIVSIWVYGCMWQCTGSRRMGRISRILHAGGQGLWNVSGSWSLRRTRNSSKMTETISLMVQKCWRNLWFHELKWTGLFSQTHTSHQCLLLKNCGSMDSASLALSRQQRGNFRWRTCLTQSFIIG